jgi:hypothetical protein
MYYAHKMIGTKLHAQMRENGVWIELDKEQLKHHATQLRMILERIDPK